MTPVHYYMGMMTVATVVELIVAIYHLRMWKHWEQAYVNSFMNRERDESTKKTQVMPMVHSPRETDKRVRFSNQHGWIQVKP